MTRLIQEPGQWNDADEGRPHRGTLREVFIKISVTEFLQVDAALFDPQGDDR